MRKLSLFLVYWYSPKLSVVLKSCKNFNKKVESYQNRSNKQYILARWTGKKKVCTGK